MAITLTYTFTAGTTISSSQVNANFTTLSTRAVDKQGDTMTGDLKFTDATYDIGKTGATRPRDGFFSRNVVVGGTLAVTSTLSAAATALAGHLTFTDATYDIGASGATRPRDLFLSRNLVVGGTSVTINTLAYTWPSSQSGTKFLQNNGSGTLSWAALAYSDFSAVMPAATSSAGVFNSTTQALTTATETVVTFDSEDFDNGTMHSTSSNTGRLTVSATGIYQISAQIPFDNDSTGHRYIYLRKNGTTAVSALSAVPGMATYYVAPSISATVSLTAADYVEVIAYQNRGGNLNIGHASTRAFQSSAQIVRLS